MGFELDWWLNGHGHILSISTDSQARFLTPAGIMLDPSFSYWGGVSVLYTFDTLVSLLTVSLNLETPSFCFVYHVRFVPR